MVRKTSCERMAICSAEGISKAKMEAWRKIAYDTKKQIKKQTNKNS